MFGSPFHSFPSYRKSHNSIPFSFALIFLLDLFRRWFSISFSQLSISLLFPEEEKGKFFHHVKRIKMVEEGNEEGMLVEWDGSGTQGSAWDLGGGSRLSAWETAVVTCHMQGEPPGPQDARQYHAARPCHTRWWCWSVCREQSSRKDPASASRSLLNVGCVCSLPLIFSFFYNYLS